MTDRGAGVQRASSVLPGNLYYVMRSRAVAEDEANAIEAVAGIETLGTGRTFDLPAADVVVICGDPDELTAADRALVDNIKNLGTPIWATTDFQALRLIDLGYHAAAPAVNAAIGEREHRDPVPVRESEALSGPERDLGAATRSTSRTPILSGGATYRLDELIRSPAPTIFRSAIDSLDTVWPAIRAGSLCAVVGMLGSVPRSWH